MFKCSATLAALLILLCSCAKSGDVFDDVGTNIASPSAMSIDAAANRLYLVNSNSKVLYDSTQGSFQIYDITNPLAPALINTLQTQSFSGEVYVDTVAKRAYMPNRYTANSAVTTGLLYNIDVDEASANFLAASTTTVGKDAYAINCCYPASRAWITTSLNELQYAALDGDLTANSVPLLSTLDTGFVMTDAQVNFIAIINNQAFLSREYGGTMVVNLDKAGDPTATAVDYFISNIENPRGIATDGALLYIVGEGTIGDTWTRYLMIVDPATLTARTGNTTTQLIDKDTSGILLATITVGTSPQNVLLSTAYAFVTNQGDDTVSVIDLATRAVVKTITVLDEPYSLALLSPAGVDQYVYVGNLASNKLSIIDINTLTVAATYP